MNLGVGFDTEISSGWTAEVEYAYEVGFGSFIGGRPKNCLRTVIGLVA